jgi:hypothetical protein
MVAADDIALGAMGSTIWPLEVSSVSMQREVIDIEVFPDSSVFTCSFTFFNHDSSDIKMVVGFPARYFDLAQFRARTGETGHLGAIQWDDFNIRRFSCWIGGEEVPVTRLEGSQGLHGFEDDQRLRFLTPAEFGRFVEKDMILERYQDHLHRAGWGSSGAAEGALRTRPPRRGLQAFQNLELVEWYVWAATFKGLSHTKIVHTYWIRNSRGGSTDGWFRYILTTGRFWKGRSIGRVDITAHFNFHPYFDFPCYGPEIEPAGFEFGDQTIEWHFNDYTPVTDLHLHWYTWFSSRNGAELCDGESESVADHQSYEMAIRLLDDGEDEEAVAILTRLAERSCDPMLGAWSAHRLKKK